MGVVVFSLANIWFALETSNEDTSLFSSETLENPTLLKGAVVAFLFTIAATELGFLNRLLDTVNLTIDQWWICLVVSLAIIVLAEVKKLLKIRTTEIPALANAQPGGRRRGRITPRIPSSLDRAVGESRPRGFSSQFAEWHVSGSYATRSI